MPHRASRLTLTLAVLVAVLSGLGSTAQVDDPVIGPYYEDASEAELAFYDTEFPCPAIDGLINNDRFVSDSVVDYMEIKCDYRVDDTSPVQTFRVEWYKTDYPSYAHYLCFDEGERSDDGTRIRDVVNDDLTMGVRGEYALDRGNEFEPGITAALRGLMTAVTPYSRTCAEPPTQLDCPEVPGMVIGEFGAGEPSENRPDSYSQSCGYESPDPNVDFRLRIEVWWSARSGVPELFDRLCNEFPMEGVGFGSLIADGVAANASYKVGSPLEGPDRAVAIAAAQALLDQAAAIARPCDEAEANPTTFQSFPQYLAPAFVPELTGPPTGGGGGFSSLPSAAPSGGGGSSDGGFIQTLIRIGSVVMFGLSMLGLFITFLLIRRETRIREKRDMLRIAITVAVSGAAVLIIGRDAPLWAILVAVGLGIALGTWQGSSLIVRSTERGLMAKRSMLAIVAFGSGVLLMQAAGFLNRSGGVTLGVAVSFLSAALTAGLFIGRKPAMAAALGGAAKAILPVALLIGLVAGFGAAVGSAQTDPTTPAAPAGTCSPQRGGFMVLDGCEGYENLLDVVPWDSAFVHGGLFERDGKPAAPISLPRGLASPPEPVTQTVSWSTTNSSDNPLDFELTETYSFGPLATGVCCSVLYEATGTKTLTRLSDDEVTVDTYEVSGRLDDVQALGTMAFGGEPLGIPFSEILTLSGLPEDSCQRGVAWRQEDNEEGAATWTSNRLNGEDSTGHVSTQVALFIDCDLPEFTFENAFALAPPIPASNDPVRVVGAFADDPGESCPVRQEFMGIVWDAGQFEGVSTQTLAELYLEPNAPLCRYGGLFSMVAFGQGGRGNTRHEVMYDLAFLNDPAAEAARLAEDSETFYMASRLTSIPLHRRCELGSDGVPLQPADGSECRYISIHSVDESGGLSSLRQTGRTLQTRNMAGGVVYIETDWDTRDGPNVFVRAHLPWGKYIYRCHHCTPGSSAVSQFIRDLHNFGVSRGRYDPAFDEEPAAADPTTETTEADPRFTEDTEFTPIGEEEGITEEEAALIGLIGLLGSMGLLGASLEGTGLTPRDIAEAVRRGDLTGGVDEPPPLLDEDGEELYVNDGSFPEAPVGHVWWGTDEDEGRWVSREEAQDLVTAEIASDEALDEDAAARVEAIFGKDGTANADWGTRMRRTRAETTAANLEAAMAGERRRVLDKETHNAWVNAINRDQMDLVDFIDRNENLTAEQIQRIFDSIHRRESDEAALAAIPEINVYVETARITQKQLSDELRRQDHPILAWAVDHPEVSVRVAAAVASGGTSEFIAIPIQITVELHEAQERSQRENGRMMTSDELFGELGWALGREAVYEAGGRLAAHGIGRIFSSTDEVAEAVLRQGDETLPAARRTVTDVTEDVSEVVSREASEFVEAGGRQLDEGLGAGARQLDEGMEAAGRQLDEGLGAGGRQLDEGVEAAGRQLDEGGEAVGRQLDETGARQLDEAGEAGARELDEAGEPWARELDETGARRVTEDLTDVPPTGNEALRDLEPGSRIPDELVDETGLTRDHLERIQNYTEKNGINASGRSSNPLSGGPLADGSAVRKPVEMKIKTGGPLDVLLGGKPQNQGVVTLFEPKMPNTTGMSDDLIKALEERHAKRMTEWIEHGDEWSKGHRVLEFGGVERTHRFYDGRVEVLFDGKWRSVGGDFDLVNLTKADGSALSPAEFNRHVKAMMEEGLIEHGGEMRVITDIMRDSPHEPFSAGWNEALGKALKLRQGLQDGHATEIVIGIGADRGLVRLPQIEVLPAIGAYEAPVKGLLDS